MQLTTEDLRLLREMCLEYYPNERSHVLSIILYGSAAKNYLGRDHVPGDFDLNMFFDAESSIRSTAGRPKIIGEHRGLDVEVMRNRIPDGTDVSEYVNSQRSKRWERILTEPIVEVYPKIKRVQW